METRLAKMELKMVDDEEKFELEIHLEGLDGKIDKFREKFKAPSMLPSTNWLVKSPLATLWLEK